jgi:signal transduction histidine kinase
MDRIPLEAFTRLVEASAAVAGQIELRAVLRTTVEMACETTNARYGAIGVLGEHGTLVDFLYHGMTKETAAAIGHPPVGKGVLGALIEDPHPIRLARLTDHPSSAGFPDNHPPMQSFLGVPVRAGDKVFGNLYLSEKPGGFDEADEQLVVALAGVAGGAVKAARLHERITRATVAEDRERIARDLHDAVIQDLFAVGLGLQGLSMSLDNPDTARRIDDAVDRIDHAISSLRSFIFDMRHFETTVADPPRTIARLVQRLTASRDVDVTVAVDALAKCSPRQLDDALGVIREAVSNAVRHSGAQHIGVTARDTDGEIEIVISDDGNGFDEASATQGLGLGNMRARAQHRAGEITVESAPGVGTTITAVFRA